MRNNKLIAIIGMILLVLTSLVLAAPQIDFLSLTPSNNSATNNTFVEINVSIVESNLNNLTYNWNGTNYTIYSDDLLLMMNFDNLSDLGESNNLVADLSNFENNGSTQNGAIYSSSGKYGGAYDFDGTNDFIAIADSSNLNIYQKTSFALWIYPEAYGDSSEAYIKNIYSDEGNQVEATAIWRLGSKGLDSLKDKLGVNYNDGDNNDIESTGSVPLNTWTHVVTVTNGTHVNFYFNGILDSSKSYSITPTQISGNWWIGVHSDGETTDRQFNGKIDEMRLWNRSLSTEEVYTEYISNLQKYNSTQWYLYVNQSKNATDNLDFGTYTYETYAKNSSGSWNNTGVRTITLQIDATPPGLVFVSPTPANATIQSITNAEINVSINESNLGNLTYNWNGTNYTMYNDSLVLMMNFDNVSSLGENDTLVADLSRHENNGTVTSATWGNMGKYNGAFNFDGANDYINVSNSISLNSTHTNLSNYTVSLWMKTTMSGAEPWSEPTIVDMRDTDTDEWVFSVYLNSNNVTSLLTGYSFDHPLGPDWQILNSSTVVNDGTWHYISIIKNNTNFFKIYVDGLLEANGPSIYNTISDEPMTIGVRRNDAGTLVNYFNGSIDELRIWNRSLSADEVYQEYISNLNKFNSSQWYLYVNQSLNATTALSDGDYTYQTFASDTNNNWNNTELRTFTIDTTNPKWQDNETNLTISATTNDQVYFNITLNETNPDSYIFSFYNSTDWVNDSAVSYTNGEEIEVVKTINVNSGIINWTWYFNDTAGNLNQSDVWSVTIVSPSIGLSIVYPTTNINATQNGWFNVIVNVTCLNNDCGEVNLSLDPLHNSGSVFSTFDGNGIGYPGQDLFDSDDLPDTTTIGKYVKFTSGNEAGNCFEILNDQVSFDILSWNEKYFVQVDAEIHGSVVEEDAYDIWDTLSECADTAETPTKSGLVNTTIGAIPFWTNTTNPYTITINNGESQLVTWWVNATGTIDTTHEFFVYANKTNDMSINNITATWNVTILELDTTYPTWENNKTNLTSSTVSGSSVYFNITLADTNPDKYIFSWYNGLDWVNDSAVSYNNGQEIEITKTISIYSGDINWTWYFNDTAGNLNQTYVWNVTIVSSDQINPSISYGPSTTTQGNKSRTSIVVQAVASDQYLDTVVAYLYNDSGLINSVSSSGSLLTTFSGLTDGTYYINATANDTSGNINYTSTRIITLDTTPPKVVAYSPADGINTSTANQNFIFNASDTNIATCTLFMDKPGYVLNASININNSIISSVNTTLNASNLENRTHTWYINCTDAAGNSNITTPRIVTVDQVPPTVTITTPKVDDILGYNIYVYTDITDNLVDIDNATYYFLNASDTSHEFAVGSLNASANWDAVWNSSSYIDAQWNVTFKVIANDTLGNSYSTNYTFTLDNVNPTIQLITPPVEMQYYNNNFSLNAIVQDYTLNYTNYSLFISSVEQSNLSSYPSNTTTHTWNDLVNVSGLSDGTYNLTLFAEDGAANTKTVSTQFTVDKTSPIVTLNYPDANLRTSATNLNFNWTAVDSIAALMYCNVTVNERDVITNVLCANNTECSYTINGLTWADYTWNVSCADNASNVNIPSGSAFIPDWADNDGDDVHNNLDKLIGTKNNVSANGTTSLGITIGGESNLTTFNESKEVLFYDGSDLIINFTHNFTNRVLDLSNVTIKKNSSYILVNFSSQLDENKTLYLADSSFTELCVKDAELNDISEISTDCGSSGEINFTTCIGNNTGVTISGITCTDEGTTIKVENLQYSAVRGTTTVSTPESTPTQQPGGGSGRRDDEIIEDVPVEDSTYDLESIIGKLPKSSDDNNDKIRQDISDESFMSEFIITSSGEIIGGELESEEEKDIVGVAFGSLIPYKGYNIVYVVLFLMYFVVLALFIHKRHDDDVEVQEDINLKKESKLIHNTFGRINHEEDEVEYKSVKINNKKLKDETDYVDKPDHDELNNLYNSDDCDLNDSENYVLEKTNEEINDINTTVVGLNKETKKIDNKLDDVNPQTNKIKTKADNIDKEINDINTTIVGLNKETKNIDNGFDDAHLKKDKIKTKADNIDKEINCTNKNIVELNKETDYINSQINCFDLKDNSQIETIGIDNTINDTNKNIDKLNKESNYINSQIDNFDKEFNQQFKNKNNNHKSSVVKKVKLKKIKLKKDKTTLTDIDYSNVNETNVNYELESKLINKAFFGKIEKISDKSKNNNKLNKSTKSNQIN